MSVTPKLGNKALIRGRQADSARRRQRVLEALSSAVKNGEEISISAIARRAGVDRSFLYRHSDLLSQVHRAGLESPEVENAPSATRSSLKAELLNAQERSLRLATRVLQLEQRLSEFLGEQTWRESGLGAPEEVMRLEERTVTLEQQIIDLRIQLEERQQDLDAARVANRELMVQLNASKNLP